LILHFIDYPIAALLASFLCFFPLRLTFSLAGWLVPHHIDFQFNTFKVFAKLFWTAAANPTLINYILL